MGKGRKSARRLSFLGVVSVSDSRLFQPILISFSGSCLSLGLHTRCSWQKWLLNLQPATLCGEWASIPDRICFWPRQGYLGDLVARSTPFTKQKIFKENFYGAIRIFPRDFRDFLFDNNERGNREKEKKKKRKGWNKYFRRESFKKRLKFA